MKMRLLPFLLLSFWAPAASQAQQSPVSLPKPASAKAAATGSPKAPAAPVPAPKPPATPADENTDADDSDVVPPPAAGSVQILEYGSFELPRVKVRSPKTAGGNFLLFAQDEWARFESPKEDKGGTLVVGLTNEVARTGRQCMYVEFSKLTRQAEAELSSQLVRVKPGSPYRVAIWGQVDKKHPLTLAQRMPNLRLQVDYFAEDMETQVNQEFSVQPLPGSRNRPPLFVPNRWNEFYVDVKTPADGFFIKMTWTWVTSKEPGETNGAMFFDDAALIGEHVIVQEPDEEMPEAPEPAEAKDDAEMAAPDATQPDETAQPEAPKTPAAASATPAPKADLAKPKPSVPAKATPSAKAATPAPKKVR